MSGVADASIYFIGTLTAATIFDDLNTQEE